jgi:hypothetical protein
MQDTGPEEGWSSAGKNWFLHAVHGNAPKTLGIILQVGKDRRAKTVP